MKKTLFPLLTLLLGCFHVQQAWAVLLLSEDFLGTGNTSGLQYTDAGSGITVGSTDPNGARREGGGTTTFYGLSAPVSSGTVYFSALFNQPTASNWGGFSYYEDGTEKLFFGNAGEPYVGPFSIDQNGGDDPPADQSPVSVSDGQTYFMVGAYDFDVGQAMLWVNPAFGSTIPAADLSVAYPSGWTLTQVRTGGDAVTDFDRIRVGTSWADVVPQVGATARTWDNGFGDNDWFNSVNWAPDGAPAESDDLRVLSGTPHTAVNVITDGGGSITIQGAGTVATFAGLPALHVGHSGVGELTIRSGGSVTTISHVYIGRQYGSQGTATVEGSGSTCNPFDELGVGVDGTGWLYIRDGGSVQDQHAFLGFANGSQGTVTVEGGESLWDNSGTLKVGISGTGTLTINAGGDVSAGAGYIAYEGGSEGTVTVDGDGSIFTAVRLYVGGGYTGGGTGRLTVQNGGTVDVADTLKVWGTTDTTLTLDGGRIECVTFDNSSGGTFTHNSGILDVLGGTFDPGTADYTIDGTANPIVQLTGGSATLSGSLRVAETRTGTLTIIGDGSFSNTYCRIGNQAGSNGTVTVEGTGSTWTNTQSLYVGDSGTGTLTIREGGYVQNTNGFVGTEPGSDGTVTVDGATWNNSENLWVGRFGTAALEITNGGMVTADLSAWIGRSAGSDGTVTVDGDGSTLTVDDWLYVGGSDTAAGGTGTLTVQNEGSVDVMNTLKVWNTGTVNHNGGLIVADGVELTGGTFHSAAGSRLRVNALSGFGNAVSLGGSLELGHAGGSGSGSYSVGAGQSLATAEGLAVGYDGSFTLNVTGGGSVSNTYGYLGRYSGSTGTATVDGTSTWTASGSLYVGGSASGAGGVGNLTTSAGGTVYVGDAASSGGWAGCLTISDWDAGGTLGGQLYVYSGSTLTHGGAAIVGNEKDEYGWATVDGTGSSWSNTRHLIVGGDGSGTLTVQNGGSVSNTIGYLGGGSRGTGTVTVDGTGSSWSNSRELYVGYYGSGTLTVQNGGSVSNTYGYLGALSGSTGTATVDGAGSSWSNSGPLSVGYSGSGTLTVQNGGSVSNTYGYLGVESGSTGTATVDGDGSTWTTSGSLYVGGSESGAGGVGNLTVQNGGAVTVANTLKVWNTGTVNLDGGFITGGAVTLSGGVLSGSGTVDAPLTAEAGSTVAPGASAGILHTGSLALAPGSTLAVELGGAVAGSGYDQLVVTGTVGLGGASLDCSLGYAPARGDRFVIISNDLDDIISGEFAGLPDDSSFRVEGYLLRIDYQGGDGNDVALSVPFAEVTKRDIFYHNSAFDVAGDELAVATDKVALRPGDPQATFDNYTSYSRGINGIIIEMDYLPDGVTPDTGDFEFTIGNDDTPGDWDEAPMPEILFDEGEGDTDRVTLLWDDYQIRNTWLEVTVLAAGLGMDENDVFYFGNAVGEACHWGADAEVNETDVLLAEDNPHNFFNPAGGTCPYDYNRDGRVNATDMLISRSNPTDSSTALSLITVPEIEGAGHLAAVPEPGTLVLLSMGAVGLLAYAWRRRRRR